MGCGGSKEEVASGNTLSSRILLRNKSRTISTTSTASTSSKGLAADVNPIDDGLKPCTDKVGEIVEVNEASEPVVVEVASVKEIITSVIDGKRVSNESFDQYFSPRKDEEAASTGTGGEGLEYFSPTHEHANFVADSTTETLSVVEASAETDGNGGASVVSIKVGDSQKPDVQVASKPGEEGKPSDKESTEAKDKLLAEEKTVEGPIADKLKARVIEIMNEPSAH